MVRKIQAGGDHCTSSSFCFDSKSALTALARDKELLESVATLLPGEAFVVMSLLSVNRYLQQGYSRMLQINFCNVKTKKIVYVAWFLDIWLSK